MLYIAMFININVFHQNVFDRDLHIVGEHLQKGNILKSPLSLTLSVVFHSHALLLSHCSFVSYKHAQNHHHRWSSSSAPWSHTWSSSSATFKLSGLSNSQNENFCRWLAQLSSSCKTIWQTEVLRFCKTIFLHRVAHRGEHHVMRKNLLKWWQTKDIFS